MKRKIHMELLATAVFAILLTLLCALFVFYGVYRKQVIGDLKADALVMKNMHIFDNISDLHPDAYDLNPDTLRITVVNANGSVIFDSNADFSVMENHEDRPEIHMAAKVGEGSGTRRSTTLDRNLFYYAIRIDNGRILRIAREGDNIFALTQNMMMTVVGVFVLLFFFCIMMANYFTKNLVAPIEQMAENLSEPGTQAAYKELVPFMNKIRQQHEDILKSSQVRQEFTANVSHELKTPLTAISGYAELIEHGMSGENTERFASEIHKNAARLLTLINDIIQLSQLDGGKKDVEYRDLDLFPLARECVDMLQMNAQKQNVTIRVQGGEAPVFADKQLMEELIYNLCDNAIRYNKKDGTVTVTTGIENGHTFLSVKDTGIGISAEHQERVFERFYRVDKSRSKATGGTGLGLAIVKVVLVLSAVMAVGMMSGCGAKSDTSDTKAKTAESSSAKEEETEEQTECELEDGTYTAEFKTDSGMFHVNEANDGKGTLTVKDGKMTIHVSLVSKNIVNLFEGTSEDAQKDGAELLEPTTDTVTYSDGATEEVYGFDIPVPELDKEFDVALIGKKGVWYDHKVSVTNPVKVEE